MNPEEVIKKIEAGKVTVVECSKMPIAELNYRIIKHLVTVRKARILFISVEKPHQYMTYILSMHKVPQRSITYVDINKNSRVRFPLTSKDMKNVKIGGFLKRDFIALRDYEYIIIDNVEFLSHFWSAENLLEFLKSVILSAKEHGCGVLMPVTGARADVCEYLGKECDVKLKVSNEVRT